MAGRNRRTISQADRRSGNGKAPQGNAGLRGHRWHSTKGILNILAQRKVAATSHRGICPLSRRRAAIAQNSLSPRSGLPHELIAVLLAHSLRIRVDIELLPAGVTDKRDAVALRHFNRERAGRSSRYKNRRA
jgi:hypothetical protein